ncbi:methyltransferase [Hoeflea sp.]|uniref:methyltransferase n=1 Tax=Hoeflea sp. TaxID=1940281 RepID=UPI003B528590
MQNTLDKPEAATVGTPVYWSPQGQRGHIVKLEAPNVPSYVIGGGGMTPTRSRMTIVWEDLTMTEIPDGIAESWIADAARYGFPPIGDNMAAELLAKATAKSEADRAERARAQADLNAATKAFRDEHRDKIPSWAKAVIVADLIEDKSDYMSDYHGSTRTRSIILAFSKHTRDLFPEMRKAALNHPETAFLADAPEKAEHRQKYSMGGGYFLKDGYRHSNGWKISKQQFYNADPVQSLPFPAVWAIPEPEAKPQQPGMIGHNRGPALEGVRIEEHTHTKKGFQMFICILPDRVDRDEFDRLRDAARDLGGWYSRPWGKTPGGFAFKSRDNAEAFAGGSDSQAAPGNAPAAPAKAAPPIADKLREMAARLQKDIDHKFADRRTNTPKQQREAASARMDGVHLERAQKAMRALADHHDAGTVPEALANVRTKAEILELSRSLIKHEGGYYDAGFDTGKPRHDSPEALAIWALIGGNDPEQEKAEALRRKIDGLKFANIPGYFPTPRAVIDRMIDLADIPSHSSCDVLEPSAGHGAIIDALSEVRPMATVTACEKWGTLRDILEAKGANLAGSDFTEFEPGTAFDFVIMNPPFEKGQDAEHVQRAFDMLKPGGRLVSVMSPGPFFRSDRKSEAFRDWFDDHGGERLDLPAGSFKESGTGTASIVVVLDKIGGDA